MATTTLVPLPWGDFRAFSQYLRSRNKRNETREEKFRRLQTLRWWECHDSNIYQVSSLLLFIFSFSPSLRSVAAAFIKRTMPSSLKVRLFNLKFVYNYFFVKFFNLLLNEPVMQIMCSWRCGTQQLCNSQFRQSSTEPDDVRSQSVHWSLVPAVPKFSVLALSALQAGRQLLWCRWCYSNFPWIQAAEYCLW